jgi:hypothetical protein
LHEHAEHIEPIVLSESGKRRDGVLFFHISTIMETSEQCQAIFQ